MMPNFYTGDMSREQGLGRLANLAARLGIPAAALRVRPQPHSRHGMTLSFAYDGAVISRSCNSQLSRDRNFVCLVLWLADLVRNIERGIESPAEAFYAEGGHRLLGAGPGTARRANLYSGKKTIDDALALIERSLVRLECSDDDIRVAWDGDSGHATLRLRLPSGRLMEKRSTQQLDARCNLAALALWFQSRAKNFERGIERDMDRLFAANLLPQRT